MAYITEADLVALFSLDEIRVLSNLKEPNATVINSARVAAAIAWATEIIDSYASVFYLTPLAIVPAILKGYAADLARYQMDLNRPREDVRQRYEDAIAWLKLLSTGKVSLGDSVPRRTTSAIPDLPSVAKDVAPPIATYRASSPIFTPRLTREIW